MAEATIPQTARIIGANQDRKPLGAWFSLRIGMRGLCCEAVFARKPGAGAATAFTGS
jgi:hypothetical protein